MKIARKHGLEFFIIDSFKKQTQNKLKHRGNMRKNCGKQWRAETPINGEDLTVNFYIEIWEPNKIFFLTQWVVYEKEWKWK